MSASEKAARRWATAPVQQSANPQDHADNWRLADDGMSVWLRHDHYGSWERYGFPVPPADEDPKHGIESFNGARLGAAFDLRGMYGPWVDLALDAREPDVDDWEAGRGRPTLDQMRRAAFLTGFKVAWFYDPKPLPAITWTSLDIHLPRRIEPADDTMSLFDWLDAQDGHAPGDR